MSWSETSGLKPTQFVRDNRKGFTFHTLVYTASGIPLGLEAGIVSDDSSTDTASRLIKEQLAPFLATKIMYYQQYFIQWSMRNLISFLGTVAGMCGMNKV